MISVIIVNIHKMDNKIIETAGRRKEQGGTVEIKTQAGYCGQGIKFQQTEHTR